MIKKDFLLTSASNCSLTSPLLIFRICGAKSIYINGIYKYNGLIIIKYQSWNDRTTEVSTVSRNLGITLRVNFF